MTSSGRSSGWSARAVIDERLEAIERLLPGYREKMIDPVDLNHEKTRLYDLRNNLGTILANLKGSLCLNLREEDFAASCRAIVKACRSPETRRV